MSVLTWKFAEMTCFILLTIVVSAIDPKLLMKILQLTFTAGPVKQLKADSICWVSIHQRTVDYYS